MITEDERNLAIKIEAQEDLYFFSRYMFKERRKYKWLHNWHHRVVCDALMKVFRGETKRLIINIPPRYSKTELAVINFMAWCFGKVPDSEFIHVSYSATLAANNAFQTRNLVQETAYKRVTISGSLEEVTKRNLALVLSGKSLEIAESTIADQDIGAVKVGEMIDLGIRNLSDVAFKGLSDAAITADKYTLDAVFGTVIFNEAITDVKWSGKSGAITRTTIANNLGEEYRFLFKGVDTYKGDKVVVTLWRVEFSPETELDLINEDFASYAIEGECLADISKASDAELSIFGHIDRFSIAA